MSKLTAFVVSAAGRSDWPVWTLLVTTLTEYQETLHRRESFIWYRMVGARRA
jgi:hypothetical protein